MGSFFTAGGWGMYPTLLFGFALLATTGLFALRPERRFAPLLLCCAALTLASGGLGFSMGVMRTFQYLEQVEPDKQLLIAGLGVAESLSNVILALILFIVSALVTLVGAVRSLRTA
jgi:hypothetical protein